MAESGNDSKDSSKDAGKPKPNFSPFSPFPYGSPLAQGSFQTSFSGSPGQRLLLGSLSQARTNGDVITPRLKGQDLYGGKSPPPVIFKDEVSMTVPRARHVRRAEHSTEDETAGGQSVQRSHEEQECREKSQTRSSHIPTSTRGSEQHPPTILPSFYSSVISTELTRSINNTTSTPIIYRQADSLHAGSLVIRGYSDH